MKIFRILLTIIALSGTAVYGQTNSPAKTSNSVAISATSTNKVPQQQQIQTFFDLLGLNQQDLRALTPDQRIAKVKEAIDKRLTVLEAKKAEGTLTEQDKKDIVRLETIKKARSNMKPSSPAATPPPATAPAKKIEDKK